MDLQREGDFLEFAQIQVVAVERQDLRQLHGDRAATAQVYAANKAIEYAAQALQVDTGVGIEAYVFCRYDRIGEYLRNIFEINRVSPIADLIDQASISRIDSQRRFQLHVSVGFG